MSEHARFVLVACSIVLVVLVFLLAKTMINDAARWLDYRSYQRARRIEQQLAKTRSASRS